MRAAASLVVGYHGCDEKVGEAAIAGTHPDCSTNAYDWLGHGLYFWENDPLRAREWAEDHLDVNTPFVLGAIIDLGFCLDLVEAEPLRLLKGSYSNLREAFKKAGKLQDMPVNETGFTGDQDLVKRNLDCAVINNLHDLREIRGLRAFDTVRSPFFEGQPLYEGARIMARTHIQICVRNPLANVIGYFRPLG